MMGAIFIVSLTLALMACAPNRMAESIRLLRGVASGEPPPAHLVERETDTLAASETLRLFDLYRRREGEPRAALVLVPGAAEAGRRDPRLVAFAGHLAVAGFEVLVPEIENLRRLRVRARDADVIADAIVAAQRRPAGAAGVGVVGISYAVGPVMLAARQPSVARRLGFIVAIGGYYDAVSIVTYFTTGGFRADPTEPWRYTVPNAYGKWVFVRSNADLLDDAAEAALLEEIARRKLDDLAAPVDDLVAGLGEDGRSVIALLENADPARAGALVDRLPRGVVAELRALDLADKDLSSITAPVFVVHGRDDRIIPYTESLSLASALSGAQVRLHLADNLAHVDPGARVWLADSVRLLRLVWRVLAIRDRLAAKSAAPPATGGP